jgi:osmotically-inducible protein OsmY
MILTTPSRETDLRDVARQLSGDWSRASWPGLRRLKVEATNDAIRITGEVGTFFEKQQAYHWARRLVGPAAIDEQISVVSRRRGVGQ